MGWKAVIRPKLETLIIFAPTPRWGFTTRTSREQRRTFLLCDHWSRCLKNRTDQCFVSDRNCGRSSHTLLRRSSNAYREFQPSIIHETGGGCAIVDSNCGTRRVRASGHSSRQGSAPEYIQPLGSEDGHQLPRYVDVFERIS